MCSFPCLEAKGPKVLAHVGPAHARSPARWQSHRVEEGRQESGQPALDPVSVRHAFVFCEFQRFGGVSVIAEEPVLP